MHQIPFETHAEFLKIFHQNDLNMIMNENDSENNLSKSFKHELFKSFRDNRLNSY